MDPGVANFVQSALLWGVKWRKLPIDFMVKLSFILFSFIFLVGHFILWSSLGPTELPLFPPPVFFFPPNLEIFNFIWEKGHVVFGPIHHTWPAWAPILLTGKFLGVQHFGVYSVSFVQGVLCWPSFLESCRFRTTRSCGGLPFFIVFFVSLLLLMRNGK